MAPKGNKRNAQKANAPPAKKPKVNKYFAAVEDAIKLADIQPENCKNMLLSMIPDGLGTPSDLRHDHQHLAVKLIGEVVEGRLAKLQEEVDAESAKLEDADAAKAEFEKTMTDAETRLASTSEDVEKKKEELAAFTKVIMEKRSTLLSTQASHSQAQDPLQKAKVQKEQYEAISQDHLQPLLKEELAAEQATSHYQVVSPLIKDLDLEDSFKQALPGTFSKQTSDRTQFDNMVLQELEKRFNAHMENLGQFVAQQEPALEELSAAAAAAHEDHEAAKKDHEKVASELAALQTVQQEAQASLDTAKQAMAQNAADYKAANKVRDQKQEELNDFKNWNLECFTMLRDEESKKPEVPEAPAEVESGAAVAMETDVADGKTSVDATSKATESVVKDVLAPEVVSTAGA